MKRIHWKNKITDDRGNGTVALPDDEAEVIVKKLNAEHPELHHWTEEAKDNEN